MVCWCKPVFSMCIATSYSRVFHYSLDHISWYFKNKFRFQSPQEIEETPAEPSTEKIMEDKNPGTDSMEEVSLTEFLKSVFAILPVSDFISHK